MKKTPIVLTLSILSSPVFAITNGTSVDWQNDFDDMVKNNCTGMIVGGNQLLTAAHCTDLTSITFADGTVMDAVTRDDHPNYLYSSSGSQYDASVWTLPQAAKAQNIHYFADLNTQTAVIGDSIKAYGVGGNNPLAYAELIVNKLSSLSRTYLESTAISGDLIQGDSGGVWMHGTSIIAINMGFSSGRLSYGTDLHYAKDFLLEKINGWHYPTVLKGTGTQTVKVQSLHQNSVVGTGTASGDVTITGGTCLSMAVIDAFDTCTYELDVTGTGSLNLTNNEVININPVKAVVPTPPATTPKKSGSSGGSMGWLSLFGLLVLGRMRQK